MIDSCCIAFVARYWDVVAYVYYLVGRATMFSFDPAQKSHILLCWLFGLLNGSVLTSASFTYAFLAQSISGAKVYLAYEAFMMRGLP